MPPAPSEAALEIARRILEVIPQSMARIRTEMRAASPSDLSVPQYRILGCVFRGMDLAGEIARHQGVSQPAMSKMIEGLVEKGLMRRETRAMDRRRVPLRLTAKGESLYKRIRKAAQLELGRRASGLSARDRQDLLSGLAQLEKLFE